MSHELRTPLNAILGMTEGLQEQVFGSINEKQLKALNTIENSGNHLLELINDILDLSKIESGRIDLDRRPTAIAPLCTASLAFIKERALKKQIQLKTELPHTSLPLFIDERRIRQVLINLLDNAVKFTPDGGCITLAVTTGPPVLTREYNNSVLTDSLKMSVTDTGIGIDSEDIPNLFQPFVQIDSALNRQYNGTGLGLALVKRIVKLHGGDVKVTSQIGEGSCFSITLPCISEAQIIDKTKSTKETTIEQPVQLNGVAPLILLAEDNEANIITLSNYLQAKGYRLIIARNGEEAVVLSKSERPEVIVMDIQMPKMDGLEATRYIRRDQDLSNTPIIALTALAMEGDRDRCLEAGADEYLSKPVRLKQLAQVIQQLLIHKRQ
jgi:CheY-like chemotaxis protein